MAIKIIDPKQASYAKVFEDLQKNVEARVDFNSWKDFYESGSGVTVTQLLAGLGSFLSYNSLASRRESGLYTAKLRSSLYSLCDTLGYPPNRKLSAQLRLQMTINQPQFWDRTIPLGVLGGVSLSLIDSHHFTGGDHLINVVCGEWETFTYTSDTNRAFAEIQFPDLDIDAIDNRFIELYINGEKIELTLYPEEMTEQNVLLKTMADRLSLVFGFQNLGRQLLKGDNIELKYIRVHGVPTTGYNLPNAQLDIEGVVAHDMQLIENLAAPDPMIKLTRVASGYFASKRRMVSREDHEFLIMSYEGIISAKVNPGWCQIEDGEGNITNYYEKYFSPKECREAGGNWKRPFECCTIEIAYLYIDEHIMLDTEEDHILTYLDEFRMQGEEIIFRDPEVVLVDAQVVIVMQEGTDTAGFDDYMRDALEKQMFILGGKFSTAEIVAAGNMLDGVIRTYLTKPIADRQLPFWKYFKLRTVAVTYTTDQAEVLEFGSSPDSGYQQDCVYGALCLHIAKGGEGNTGEFEIWVDGQLWRTETTDVPYNSTGEWDFLSLEELYLSSNINHQVMIKPVNANSHILVNKIVYDARGYEAKTDGAVGATQGAAHSGAVEFDSYVKLNQHGTLTFNVMPE